MLELIESGFKEEGQGIGLEGMSPAPMAKPPAAALPVPNPETSDEDAQAILRWIDEGNPNCQGILGNGWAARQLTFEPRYN